MKDGCVETRWGTVRGAREGGLQVFRGIPYARPPLGDLRFRAPRTPLPWSGERDATRFGPSAPQNPLLLPLPGMDVGPVDEDCLYLNVWTPGADDLRRPVMVWIHGGGFVIGSGSQTLYDGAALARRGDVVVVTLNYRLGPLGFLHLRDLCPDLEGAVANAGLRDQVAALEWVRDHIESFGGDPGRVTVFGESAGGMSVGTLLGMPSARGLFHRAIAQSGAGHNFHTRETATEVARSFLDELGLAPARAAGTLRELPVGRLLDTQQQTLLKLGRSRGLLPFQPGVDGDSLPAQPLAAVRGGAVADVPLLTGTTRDEWRLFAFIDADVLHQDAAGVAARLAERLPDLDAEELLATYRQARQGRAGVGPSDLFFAVETDRVFRIPALRLAEAQCTHQRSTFLYRFDWESPGLGGALGACHAIELPFVFGNLGLEGIAGFAGSGPQAETLAGRVMDAWIAFARSGDPNHAGLPDWLPYEPGTRPTLILGPECRLERDPDAAEREFWEGRL